MNVILYFCIYFTVQPEVQSAALKYFLIDIPDNEVTANLYDDQVYYDYDENIRIEFKKFKLKGNEKKVEKEHELKCERFGSMYGTPLWKHHKYHKCKLQKLRQRVKRYWDTNQLVLLNDNLRLKNLIDSDTNVSNGPQITQPDTESNELRSENVSDNDDDKSGFAQDYLDNFWRTRAEGNQCTPQDILSKKCKGRRSIEPTNLVSKRTFSSDSDSASNSESVSIEYEKKLLKIPKKVNRFKVIDNESKLRKPIKKPYKPHTESESEADVSGEVADLSKEETVNEVFSKSSEAGPELSEPEKSGSSEVSEEKIPSKYAYLQAHRLLKNHDYRRRMPHFLPKRYHWTEDQMKHLSYYWYKGPYKD